MNKYKVENLEFGIKAAELQEGPFYPHKVPIQLSLIMRS
jgi:hypothetical protein